jgi:hypothetical protein
VFIGYPDRGGTPEMWSDRWLTITSILTRLPEGEVQRQGYEIIKMPEGETLRGQA